MGRKDDRDAAEKAAWSKDEMNKAREDQERELGNPLAPPE